MKRQELTLNVKLDKVHPSMVEFLNAVGLGKIKGNSDYSLILAGGSLRTFITGEAPNDFDLFIVGKDLGKRLEVYRGLVEKFESEFECVFKCPKDEVASFKASFGKVQLINPMHYETVWDLLSSFDLSPSLFAFNGSKLYLKRNSIRDVKKKVCNLSNLYFPFATMNRIFKYKTYGYNVYSAQNDFLALVSSRDFSNEALFRNYLD